VKIDTLSVLRQMESEQWDDSPGNTSPVLGSDQHLMRVGDGDYSLKIPIRCFFLRRQFRGRQVRHRIAPDVVIEPGQIMMHNGAH